mmetsp:Transcript_104912/g.302780  ORF Transcript_104912/g.302780 Transcript_104912/m.302780 type:complete len:318 (+) Transcript_104912:3452-4405(+)
MDDEVLSVSPFSTLFVGIKASYAWYYEVLDMLRRLALTCGTMLFREIASLILFSLCIALIALLYHTQALPYDNLMMDNIVAMMHWQTLLAVIVLLVMDSAMFEDLATDLLGGVLIGTNTLMLLMLFVPIHDKLRLMLKDVIKSGRNQLFPTKIVRGEWGQRHRAKTIGDTLADREKRGPHSRRDGRTNDVEEADFEMHHLPTTVCDYTSSVSAEIRTSAAHRRTALDEALHASVDGPTSPVNRFSFEVTEVIEEADLEGDADSPVEGVAESLSWDEGNDVAKSLLTLHEPKELVGWIKTWRDEGRVAKALKVSHQIR